MRPRNEVLLGLGLVAAFALGAEALARRRAHPGELDPRASSFLTGPAGVRGLADALERLHVTVRRVRERLVARTASPPGARQALLVLEPTEPLSPPEVRQLARFSGGDLVMAGRGTGPLMRCFGYQTGPERLDSFTVHPAGGGTAGRWPRVARTLRATGQAEVIDSSRLGDLGTMRCRVPAVARAETLMVTASGAPVMVRLTLAGPGRAVTLASDANLFRNRPLRLTDAGPFVLGLFAGRYDEVLFEEYHHGYGVSGSLAGAALAWSLRSPWGWAVWQLAAVGLLALGFGAVRFGPVRTGIVRRRRSPLEHVRALATALAAAKGHDVAIGTLIRGLRRRLVPAGLRAGGDWRPWFRHLDRHHGSDRSRRALATLDELTRPGQPPDAVLRAATAVEDLWQELKP